MNKPIKWILYLCLMMPSLPAAAQDVVAEAILKRYEQATGMDQLLPKEMECMMTEVESETQGTKMSMRFIVKRPDKMRMEMTINGQQILMVISGSTGWMNVPGMGVQPMNAAMMTQMRDQIAMIERNYMWDRGNATYTMVDEVQEGDKTYQGVQIMQKNFSQNSGTTILYFDTETGLIDHMTVYMGQGEQAMSTRLNLMDYKEYGKIRVASGFLVILKGVVITKTILKSIQYNYSATDDLFVISE